MSNPQGRTAFTKDRSGSSGAKVALASRLRYDKDQLAGSVEEQGKIQVYDSLIETKTWDKDTMAKKPRVSDAVAKLKSLPGALARTSHLWRSLGNLVLGALVTNGDVKIGTGNCLWRAPDFWSRPLQPFQQPTCRTRMNQNSRHPSAILLCTGVYWFDARRTPTDLTRGILQTAEWLLVA